MTVFRDKRSELDPRFSKRVIDSFLETGLDRIKPRLDLVYGLDPDFAELYTQYVRGDMYSRDVLSQAHREICAVAALSCLDKQDNVRSHLISGVILGATKQELLEAIIQSVVYGGLPAALTSLQTYADVFPEMVKKDRPALPADGDELPPGPIYQPAVDLATRLFDADYGRALHERYNRHDAEWAMAAQRYVWGGIYSRTVIDLKLRELIAVACLTVKNALQQMASHARGALGLGWSRAEVQEVILQMGTYASWPYMIQALRVYEEVANEFERGAGAEGTGP
jgi:4-carboxymuconolactone decarboxylase